MPSVDYLRLVYYNQVYFEFIGGGDMLYKATGITERPAEMEQYKEYE